MPEREDGCAEQKKGKALRAGDPETVADSQEADSQEADSQEAAIRKQPSSGRGRWSG